MSCQKSRTLRIVALLGLITLLGSAPVAAQTSDSELGIKSETEWHPALVTFGSSAKQADGDHDRQQIIRISLPADSGKVTLRIFDPDIGGSFDEPQRGFNTKTRFALFGDGSRAFLERDNKNAVQERIEGEPLFEKTFGYKEELDGAWIDLAELDPEKGIVSGKNREFYLLIKGIAGNDGNVFDVGLSTVPGQNSIVAGARMYSFIPTFQLAEDPSLKTELRFKIPEDTRALIIENFDSAGANIAYEGRFRFQSLKGSDKSEWQIDRIPVYVGESSLDGSVTARSGEENPNDMTVFIGAVGPNDNDPASRPIAVELPPKHFREKLRPQLKIAHGPIACSVYKFDATGSLDPAGDELAIRWRADKNLPWHISTSLEYTYDKPGIYTARIETQNTSERVSNGTARNLRVVVKDRPHAHFKAPELIPEEDGGTNITFNASNTTVSAIPKGNALTRLEWDFGDGQKLVQTTQDADFGHPKHIYKAPGIYNISLTAIDDPDHPCNSDVFHGQIVINGKPTAYAGADIELITGKSHVFDASQSADPEGALVGYHWSFGDGTQGSGRTKRHTFHKAGSYSVSLIVQDNNLDRPLVDTHSIEVNVFDFYNIAPTARAGDDKETHVGIPVMFDASKSYDEDGNILHYKWSFEEGHTSEDPIVEHTFWKPGTYSVALDIVDDLGKSKQDTLNVVVEPAPNSAPSIKFAKLVNVAAFDVLQLDASGAVDTDGHIVAYDWSFGDGSTANGPKVSHQYLKSGTYKATLTLTDNANPIPALTIHEFEVVVAYRPNMSPIADAGTDRNVLARELVEFDASGSHDPDGSILSYKWDFGDGSTSSGIRTNHIYQAPGEYAVGLTVIDENTRDPATATDNIFVRVAWPENNKPVANAGSDLSVAVGEIIPFDGSQSFDSDGNIKQYAWDFGDGGVSQQASPAHTFHDPGEFTVKLTVTDDGVVPLKSSHSVVVSVVKRK